MHYTHYFHRLISITLLFGSFLISSYCQTALTIQDCYDKARSHYPAIAQYQLLNRSNDLKIKNLQTGRFPQALLLAQATYQSDVTRVPFNITNADIPRLDKDQYKAFLDINQIIYDGGTIKHLKSIQSAQSNFEIQNLEQILYSLKERVTQLFFAALLSQEYLYSTQTSLTDLDRSISKLQHLYQNGVITQTSLFQLQAEKIKLEQKITELNFQKSASLQQLSNLIHHNSSDSIILITPADLPQRFEMLRVELNILHAQELLVQQQRKLIHSKNLPKVSLFAQTGIGKPALNIFTNTFDPFWITGIKTQWNISSYYTKRKELSLASIQSDLIQNQKDIFNFNQDLKIQQTQSELEKHRALLQQDDALIELRKKISQTTKHQLEQGVITSSDYLKEFTAEELAKENKISHYIQYLLFQYMQHINFGN